jgi:hypothetical protein
MQPITPVIDLQLLDALESRLGRLAARWRGTEDAAEAAVLVQQYQSILLWMIELGYRDSLDVDAKLPDELLPAAYLDLHSLRMFSNPMPNLFQGKLIRLRAVQSDDWGYFFRMDADSDNGRHTDEI